MWLLALHVPECRAFSVVSPLSPPLHCSRADRYDQAKSYADSGFLPDTIDKRDRIYIPDHPAWYGSWLLPTRVDLSNTGLLPPTLNQGQLGSCVANAAANTIRYMVRRATNGTADFAPRSVSACCARHLRRLV